MRQPHGELVLGLPQVSIHDNFFELGGDSILAIQIIARANQAAMNLHVRMASGRNPHHIVEATFKSLARALDLATQRDPRVAGVLSTKGTL